MARAKVATFFLKDLKMKATSRLLEILRQFAEALVYGILYFDCTVHHSTSTNVTVLDASGEPEICNVRLIRVCMFRLIYLFSNIFLESTTSAFSVGDGNWRKRRCELAVGHLERDYKKEIKGESRGQGEAREEQ